MTKARWQLRTEQADLLTQPGPSVPRRPFTAAPRTIPGSCLAPARQRRPSHR